MNSMKPQAEIHIYHTVFHDDVNNAEHIVHEKEMTVNVLFSSEVATSTAISK